MDVAAVFGALCSFPIFAARLGRLAGRDLTSLDIERLSTLVYLHDLGKLMPGFQAKARPELHCPSNVNHSAAGVTLLSRAMGDPTNFLAPVIRKIEGWGEAVEDLMLGIFAHHGRPVPIRTSLGETPAVAGYDLASATRAYLQMLEAAFSQGGIGQTLPDAPGFVHQIAGLAALADWIGSDCRFFDFVAHPSPDYPEYARRQAELALREIGLSGAEPAAATGFAQIAGGHFLPRAAQRLIGDTDPQESQLLLLEAETGSGKTEAALWRYILLHEAGLVSGLYFAVPTRAAARQLHRRVNDAIQRIFGASAPEAVLAIPGQLVAGEATGQRLPDFETRWDDAEGPKPARWAAEHATRFLAASVAVGTVDQAMLAGLQVKHAHLRGAALSRSLLVIDEVHASDQFMTEILAELLHGHLKLGGQAMLMSATLGSRARSRFLNVPQPDLATARVAPYPALWSLGTSVPAMAAPEGRQKTVAMERLATMDSAQTADRALELARQGARVLVIRNTVTAACATYDAVMAAGGAGLLLQVAGAPTLHHSRFAAEDRALLDQAVENLLAPRKDRALRGAVVIGSQTLEQSLDICADFLITDLCPVDVLLQRLGRLHRHDLPRPPGFEVPCCLVLCPEEGLEPLTKPAFVNGLGAWSPKDGTTQGIYLDLPCLSLTESLVADRAVWAIPAMNRELVELATHPEARSDEIARRGDRWLDYEIRILGREASQIGQARNWLLKRDARFPDTFPSEDEHIQTRLGSQGPVLGFAPGTSGPFGREISRIVLPAHWVRGKVPDAPIKADVSAEGLHFSLGDAKFLYGLNGLTRKIGA